MNQALTFHGRLRLSAEVAAKLRAHHLRQGAIAESFSYVLGHSYRDTDGVLTIVLADPSAVILFGEEPSVSASFASVSLDKEVKAQVFYRAAELGYTAVVDVHDHHFSEVARFSGVDDADDRVNAVYVRETIQKFVAPGKELVAAALLLSRGSWAARTVSGTSFVSLRVDIVGETFECMSALARVGAQQRHSRHDGLVSPAQQQLMALSHVVVVGAGGTASIAVEGLLRLGFGKLTAIDADLVEESNLNRLQAAGPLDVGRPKVSVLGDHASRIAPSAKYQGVQTTCFAEPAIAALESADVIVCCVDNAESRWWLNHFAVHYLVPLFDCGVAVFTQPKVRHEMRASVVLPRVNACGHCSPVAFYDRARPRQFLDHETLHAQRAAGYLVDRPEAEASPSVYIVNQQAVAMMLRELMNWVCGWAPVASISYWRSDEDTLRRVDRLVGDVAPWPGCPVCDFYAGACREGDLPTEQPLACLESAAADLDGAGIRFALNSSTNHPKTKEI